MKASRINGNKKSRVGRPPTGKGALLGQRWHEPELAEIDRWRRVQADMPTRSEAIRRLVELGLSKSPPGERRATGRAPAAKAKELAGKMIDRLSDSTAPAEEQASRKRHLLKGPEEFREVRVDRAKAKGK
jgi:hypothetical protein